MKKLSRTCVAIIKTKRNKLIMAGDRRVSCNWGFSYNCPNPKIKKKSNGILLGASGDSALCKLVVDIFEPPEVDIQDLDVYMCYKFLPALNKLIKGQPGYQDEHKLLRIAPNEACSMIVGIKNKAFTVEINNPYTDIEDAVPALGRILIDDIPLPFAIGCGSDAAMPILLTKLAEYGYNTQEHLDQAIRHACKVSPGCALNDKDKPDFIFGD